MVKELDEMPRAPEFESRSHDYLNLGHGNSCNSWDKLDSCFVNPVLLTELVA